mgnify:CR=1 FL=1
MYHKQEALPGRLYYQDAEDRSRSSGSGGCERKRAFGKGYMELAEKILNICREQETVCILHSFPEAALELGCDSLHLPLPVLMKMEPGNGKAFGFWEPPAILWRMRYWQKNWDVLILRQGTFLIRTVKRDCPGGDWIF